MRLDEKLTSVASFGRTGKTETTDSKLPKIRVCVLGSSGVGKTAVVVRYLTSRFIGEYCSGRDLLYKKTVKIDDIPSPLEIADTSNIAGEFSFPSVHVAWADACIVVYSITSTASFEAALSMLEAIQRLKVPFYLPVLLLANQKDLEHLRQVRTEDGQALAVQNNCHFVEVSAAEEVDRVVLTMTSLFREVRTLKSHRTAVRQKRPTLQHVSKLLSSLIGRGNTATTNEVETEKRLRFNSTMPVLCSPDDSYSLGRAHEEDRKEPVPQREMKTPKGLKKRPSFSL